MLIAFGSSILAKRGGEARVEFSGDGVVEAYWVRCYLILEDCFVVDLGDAAGIRAVSVRERATALEGNTLGITKESSSQYQML